MSCEVHHKDGSVEVYPDATCGTTLQNIQAWFAANPVKVQLIVASLAGVVSPKVLAILQAVLS